jgi:starvation-inducible outer membrane lipoprotein
MRTAFVIGFVMFLTACTTIPSAVSETEVAICDSIGAALPTRSRSDTAQTSDEITRLYATFAAACPRHQALIPR